MKRIIILLLALILAGCVSVEIPAQIKEEFTYTKVFKTDFDSAISAASYALEDLGWHIAYVSKTTLTKKDRTLDNKPRYQAYIFTKIKQTQLIITSVYSTFNLRVESLDDNSIEIGVRYLRVIPIPPFYNKKTSYKNDRLVKKLYAVIERNLNQ